MLSKLRNAFSKRDGGGEEAHEPSRIEHERQFLTLGPLPRPQPNAELLKRNLNDELPERVVNGAPLDVVFIRKEVVVVEVRELVRVPAAKGEPLNRVQKKPVPEGRKPKAAVHQIVGAGTVGDEAEPNHAEEGDRPVAAQGKERVGRERRERVAKSNAAADGSGGVELAGKLGFG